MEPDFYQRWWPLHLRTVRGDTLSADDQAVYLAGLKELEADERHSGQEAELRRLREEIQDVAAQNAVLDQRRREMQAEMDALQAFLSKQPV